MTVTANDRYVSIASDGATTGPYNFDFTILSAADLLVIGTDTSGVETTYTYPDDYSVTGLSSGFVTFDTAPPEGTIEIYGNTPLTQGLSLTNQGEFPAAGVMAAFDKLTWILQEVDKRADVLEAFQDLFPTTLTASYFLTVNSGGTAFELTDQLPGTIAASAVTVDVSGFGGNLTSGATTVQLALQQLNDLAIAGADDQIAAEVPVSASAFSGNLTTSATDVQAALNEIDALSLGTDDQVASEVPVSASSFSGNLTTGATDVQAALDEVDALEIPTVNYTALSIIPGLMLERTGTEGAGLTLSAETSPYTVSYTLPDGKTLSDSVEIEQKWSVYPSTDNATITATAVMDDDSVLTTSGYNWNYVIQTADGTPAIASAESYAAANMFGASGCSNVSSEKCNALYRMAGRNDALTRKSWYCRINQFRHDDDLSFIVAQIEVLSTKRVKSYNLNSSAGTISGYAGQRMSFA